MGGLRDQSDIIMLMDDVADAMLHDVSNIMMIDDVLSYLL